MRLYLSAPPLLFLFFLRILYLQEKGQASHMLPVDTLQKCWRFRLTVQTQTLSALLEVP